MQGSQPAPCCMLHLVTSSPPVVMPSGLVITAWPAALNATAHNRPSSGACKNVSRCCAATSNALQMPLPMRCLLEVIYVERAGHAFTTHVLPRAQGMLMPCVDVSSNTRWGSGNHRAGRSGITEQDPPPQPHPGSFHEPGLGHLGFRVAPCDYSTSLTIQYI